MCHLAPISWQQTGGEECKFKTLAPDRIVTFLTVCQAVTTTVYLHVYLHTGLAAVLEKFQAMALSDPLVELEVEELMNS